MKDPATSATGDKAGQPSHGGRATLVVAMITALIAAMGLVPYREQMRNLFFTAPNVCGTWRSESSKKTYVFRCREGGAFDVYVDRSGEFELSGDGMQVKYSVIASLDIKRDGRPVRRALLNLSVVSDDELEGTFSGQEDDERGNMKFVRLR